jgi:hypothetical protein
MSRVGSVTTAVRRPPLLGQGLVAAAVAGVLLGASLVGDLPLLLVVVACQVLSVLGFLALADAPAGGGTFVVSLAALIAADLVVWFEKDAVGGLAGVVAVALVGSLLHQLSREDRSRVTESLADTLVAVVVVCAFATLVATQRQADDPWVLRVGLVAAGAGLLAGRLGDRLVSHPILAPGAERAWPGLLLGLGAGLGASVLVGASHLGARDAALVGLLVVTVVAALDLLVDLAAAELRDDAYDARRAAALRPTGALLPFALLGPVTLTAVRLLGG